MEIEYVDMRNTIPSGSSTKITIPMKIIREIWGKTEEMRSEGRPGSLLTTVKRFPICFFHKNEKIILELPENILKSEEYPRELVDKVRKDFVRCLMQDIIKKVEKSLVDLSKGRISTFEFEKQVKNISYSLRKISMTYKHAFSKRELHFIAIGDIEEILSVILLRERREKEDIFFGILSELSNFIEEIENMKTFLKIIDNNLKQGKIDRDFYNILFKRYSMMLFDFENQMNRIKKLICNS